MKYLEYLENLIDYTITEDSNYAYQSGTVVIIKYLAGTNYLGSRVQPVQLAVYTDDVEVARETMQTFAQTYSNTSFKDLDNNYIRQTYQTPFVLNVGQSFGSNYTSQIIVSGILIISTNVSDIKKVEIDGAEIETVDRSIVLSAVNDTQRLGDDSVMESISNGYHLTLTVTAINKASELTQKIRQIRRGERTGDVTFSVVVTHEDNDDTESYTMRLVSASLNSSNGVMPSTTYVFIK
jgi:hypothetical protein